MIKLLVLVSLFGGNPLYKSLSFPINEISTTYMADGKDGINCLVITEHIVKNKYGVGKRGIIYTSNSCKEIRKKEIEYYENN